MRPNLSTLLLLLLAVAGCDALDTMTEGTKDSGKRIEGTERLRAELEIQRLQSDLELYHARTGEWPADWSAVKRSGRDPWGNAYLFVIDNESAIVFSAGPDGEPNTDDDVFRP